MRKQRSQKKELDQIGRKLLRQAQISNAEIEHIVAAPQLFDAVKTRIKAERRGSQGSSDNWRGSFFWNWQRISALSAAFVLFVFGTIGFFLISNSSQTELQAAIVPPIHTGSETIAPISEDLFENEVDEIPEIKPQLIAKKKIFKKEALRKPKSERKTPSVKKPKQSETELLKDFYALNYMGNPNDAGESLRIVRADLSPSTLFALGVNVPIENAREKIKTDLLVGSDGVARAIRFVE